MESGATVFNRAQERERHDGAQQDLTFLNHRGGNIITKTVFQQSTKPRQWRTRWIIQSLSGFKWKSVGLQMTPAGPHHPYLKVSTWMELTTPNRSTRLLPLHLLCFKASTYMDQPKPSRSIGPHPCLKASTWMPWTKPSRSIGPHPCLKVLTWMEYTIPNRSMRPLARPLAFHPL